MWHVCHDCLPFTAEQHARIFSRYHDNVCRTSFFLLFWNADLKLSISRRFSSNLHFLMVERQLRCFSYIKKFIMMLNDVFIGGKTIQICINLFGLTKIAHFSRICRKQRNKNHILFYSPLNVGGTFG